MTHLDMQRWEELNAFVDGALAPDKAAAFARLLEADPLLRAQVAEVRQLKETTRRALSTAEEDLPPLQLPAEDAGFRRSRAWVWPVAAAALLLMLAVGFQGFFPDERKAGFDAWLAAAAAEHEAWLAQEPGVAEGASLAATATAAGLPDLGLAGLTLAVIKTAPTDDGPLLFAGYIGTNGCRVGLWIAPALPGQPADLTAVQAEGLQGYTWPAAGRGYLLLARGMDERRLESLAKLLRHEALGQVETAAVDDPFLGLPCLG